MQLSNTFLHIINKKWRAYKYYEIEVKTERFLSVTFQSLNSRYFITVIRQSSYQLISRYNLLFKAKSIGYFLVYFNVPTCMSTSWLDANRVKNFFWKKPFIRIFLNITLFIAGNDGGISLINFLLNYCQIFLKTTKVTTMIYAKTIQLFITCTNAFRVLFQYS